MEQNSSVMTEAAALKELMHNFLQERLDKKLDELQKEEHKKSAITIFDEELEKLKNKYEEKKQSVIDGYQLEVWLDDAAKRVAQLTLVTHAVKYQNPDAKGSSLYAAEEESTDSFWVSTASLRHPANDVVGNAAALDVYKFLHISHQEETILSRIFRNDEALHSALPASDEKKDRWFQEFRAIKSPKIPPTTHTLAKQLYFPVGDGKYHLLAPLFPTVLANEVYRQVQNRFDDITKEARKAKKESKSYPHGYRDYPNLAVQNFGGTKPQNISQLNSERRGQAFLLPSLPPSWNSAAVRVPFCVESVFPKIFAGRVKRLTNELKNFFVKVQDRESNAGIRQTRAELVRKIVDELLQYSSEIQGLLPGWSTKPECHLQQAEVFWLDPDRADDEWQRQRDAIDWEWQISHEFANWLNATLQTDRLRFGDDERLEWKKLLQKELAWLTPEII
jgi:CRISPR-associated protein Csy1